MILQVWTDIPYLKLSQKHLKNGLLEYYIVSFWEKRMEKAHLQGRFV